MWASWLGYPRSMPLPTIESPDSLEALVRVPAPNRGFSRAFARMLLIFDDSKLGLSFVGSIQGAISKESLNRDDEPYYKAVKTVSQLVSVYVMYSLYSWQWSLFFLHVHRRLHDAIYQAAYAARPKWRGRLKKWQEAREFLLSQPLHPIVSFLVGCLQNATTSTPSGEQPPIWNLTSRTNVIDGALDALNEEGANLDKQPDNFWLATKGDKEDDAKTDGYWSIPDLNSAFEDSAIGKWVEMLASGLQWKAQSAPSLKLGLDRNAFAFTDGKVWSQDPTACLLGLKLAVPANFPDLYRMSGWAKNAWNGEEAGDEIKPLPELFSNTSTALQSAQRASIALIPMWTSRLPTGYASPLRFAHRMMPLSMLLGEKSYVQVQKDGSKDPVARRHIEFWDGVAVEASNGDKTDKKLPCYVEADVRFKSVTSAVGAALTEIGPQHYINANGDAAYPPNRSNRTEGLVEALKGHWRADYPLAMPEGEDDHFSLRLPAMVSYDRGFLCVSSDWLSQEPQSEWCCVQFDNELEGIGSSDEPITRVAELLHIEPVTVK